MKGQIFLWCIWLRIHLLPTKNLAVFLSKPCLAVWNHGAEVRSSHPLTNVRHSSLSGRGDSPQPTADAGGSCCLSDQREAFFALPYPITFLLFGEPLFFPCCLHHTLLSVLTVSLSSVFSTNPTSQDPPRALQDLRCHFPPAVALWGWAGTSCKLKIPILNLFVFLLKGFSFPCRCCAQETMFNHPLIEQKNGEYAHIQVFLRSC